MDPARRLWEARFLHKNDPQALKRFADHEFQIIRKPPETVLAMRRIVYDNDHPAKDLHAARWADRDKDGAWKADDAHGFRLASADDKVHWLGYRHLLRGQEDKPQLITDFMGYNTPDPDHMPSGVNWVDDLILDCEVQPDQAQGELTLELSKGVDRFQARFDLATGECRLLRVGEEKPLASQPTALKGGGKHTVRFADVDQRLTVWVDDALPFGDGVTYQAPEKDGKTIEGATENDLQPASVGVKGTAAAVRGLRLWRDTYYTTALDGNPANPDWRDELPDDGPGVNFADPTTWGKLSRLPTRTHVRAAGKLPLPGRQQPAQLRRPILGPRPRPAPAGQGPRRLLPARSPGTHSLSRQEGAMTTGEVDHPRALRRNGSHGPVAPCELSGLFRAGANRTASLPRPDVQGHGGPGVFARRHQGGGPLPPAGPLRRSLDDPNHGRQDHDGAHRPSL